MAIQQAAISRAPRPSSLADVLDLILDKGLVIDAYVRVSVIGIEILTVDARIVVASVDTYLRFAEAVNRLDLTQTHNSMTLEDLQRGGAEEVGEGKTRKALEGVKERVEERVGGGRGSDEDEDENGRGDRGRDDDREDDDRDDDDSEGGGGLRGAARKVAQRARFSD